MFSVYYRLPGKEWTFKCQFITKEQATRWIEGAQVLSHRCVNCHNAEFEIREEPNV